MELSENEIRITKLAMDEFLKRKVQANLNMEFELELVSPYCTHLKQQRQDLKERTAKKYGTLWLWLTLNPDTKKTTFEKFRDKVASAASRNMISEYYYCFEQRSTTVEDGFLGFHAHCLFKRSLDYNQRKITTNLKNSFKSMMNVEDFHLFNYHWCPQEYLPQKINYMTGTKVGLEEEQKQLKQTIDVLFRQEKNIDLFYTNASEETKKEIQEAQAENNNKITLQTINPDHITNSH